MLNPDQLRIFTKVRDHVMHQYEHEHDNCNCNEFKPLHMFFSGVGGTGKSFLIETIRSLVVKIWREYCEVLTCAPIGLAAFDVGGVTVNKLLQLNNEATQNKSWDVSLR